jgi:hypothetical protein
MIRPILHHFRFIVSIYKAPGKSQQNFMSSRSHYACKSLAASSFTNKMTEIHGAYDTILILDFGSQVCPFFILFQLGLSDRFLPLSSIAILSQDDAASSMSMPGSCHALRRYRGLLGNQKVI